VVNAAPDPISGQPELKHTPVRLTPYGARWQAFLVTRRRIDLAALSGTSFALAAANTAWRYELAGVETPLNWDDWARRVFPEPRRSADWLAYEDSGAAIFRYAQLVGDRLDACVFVAPQRPAVARDWLVSLFAASSVAPHRPHLLAGQPGPGTSESGKLVCVCATVGERAIETAITRDRLDTVDAIGAATGAGINCGSCRPEIALLLRRKRELPAA
jgi:assimilatory nitrate reductase catalytic subunit